MDIRLRRDTTFRRTPYSSGVTVPAGTILPVVRQSDYRAVGGPVFYHCRYRGRNLQLAVGSGRRPHGWEVVQ